jgi:hypothetical protein
LLATSRWPSKPVLFIKMLRPHYYSSSGHARCLDGLAFRA